MKYALYWDWVKSECKVIGSDGCSKVPDFYLAACQQHDCSYYYAKDPVDAYRHYRTGSADPWKDATPITKAQADAAFRKEIQERSIIGVFSPLSWWRWAGVKWFGKKAWNSHKATHNAST